MKRCVRCGSDRIQGVELAEVVPVGELEFEGLVRGFRCEACGEEYLDGVDTGHLEGCIAAWLAEHGEISREAFRFMRKAIGMRAAELAELLDVTPETVSHWETGKYSIPWSAVAILGAIVSEHHAGGPQRRWTGSAGSKSGPRWQRRGSSAFDVLMREQPRIYPTRSNAKRALPAHQPAIWDVRFGSRWSRAEHPERPGFQQCQGNRSAIKKLVDVSPVPYPHNGDEATAVVYLIDDAIVSYPNTPKLIFG